MQFSERAWLMFGPTMAMHRFNPLIVLCGAKTDSAEKTETVEVRGACSVVLVEYARWPSAR